MVGVQGLLLVSLEGVAHREDRVHIVDAPLHGILKDLDERMAKVEERYNRQFLAMQSIIEEMNSTKESLIASFENLPFTNRKD